MSVLPFAAPHQKFESQVPLEPFHRLSVLNSSAKVRCRADLSRANLNWPAANWLDRLVGEDEKLAAGQVKPDVRARLNHVIAHLSEGCEAVAADANGIIGAEIQDQVAAVAAW